MPWRGAWHCVVETRRGGAPCPPAREAVSTPSCAPLCDPRQQRCSGMVGMRARTSSRQLPSLRWVVDCVLMMLHAQRRVAPRAPRFVVQLVTRPPRWHHRHACASCRSDASSSPLEATARSRSRMLVSAPSRTMWLYSPFGARTRGSVLHLMTIDGEASAPRSAWKVDAALDDRSAVVVRVTHPTWAPRLLDQVVRTAAWVDGLV